MRPISQKILLFFLLLSSSILSGTGTPQISLLTEGSTDEEVFLLYGHTGIRVRIPEEGYDYVFNYGYFSMEQPNFILNFILGKPLYMLGVTPIDLFLDEYGKAGRSVTEQVLNLKDEEVQAFVDFLEWNAQPENAQYRYNFFFDNCATRPRDLIERFSGGLIYRLDSLELPSFREAAREKSRSAQWYTFGTDIALGSRSDEKMSIKDAAYLPDYLMKEMDTALRKDDGTPIVLSKTEILPQVRQIENSAPYWPNIVFGLLLLAIAVRYFFAPDPKTDLKAIASLVFAVLGVLGITLWFLAIFSQHPHMSPNENMLLYHPFWFLLIPLLFRKNLTKRTLYEDLLFWTFTVSLGAFAVLVLIPGGQVMPRGELILWLSAVLLTIFAFYPNPKQIA